MITIKDIAEHAGVSPATVSIVLNGNEKERRISKETCNKVMSAAKALNYQFNTAAKKLRQTAEQEPVIGFFWSSDIDCTILGRAIQGIRNASCTSNPFELIIHPYESGHLSSCKDLLIPGNLNAAIVISGNVDDIDFLDNHDTLMPVIVLGAQARKCSFVTSNSWQVGYNFAEAIAAQGYRRIGFICMDHEEGEVSKRRISLEEECKKRNIQVTEEDCVRIPFANLKVAYEAVLTKLANWIIPPVLYCDNDIIALGTISALREHQISVPTDVKIISSSAEGQDFSKYSSPSLSIAEIPFEEMGTNALMLVFEFLKGHLKQNTNIICDVPIVYRDSFPL